MQRDSILLTLKCREGPAQLVFHRDDSVLELTEAANRQQHSNHITQSFHSSSDDILKYFSVHKIVLLCDSCQSCMSASCQHWFPW